MVGAPLEKGSRFLDRALDPSIAAFGGPWGVDPGPAAFLAAPSISPSRFSVPMIVPRRRRLSDLRARKDSQGHRRWVSCAPQLSAKGGLGHLRRGAGVHDSGQRIGPDRLEVGLGSPKPLPNPRLLPSRP